MNSRKNGGRDKIIVALDVATASQATALVRKLAPSVRFFKVGFQLFTAAGPDFIREVVSSGSKVFLDLKLHDIPNTVARAVESATKLGAEMLTIHLSGGEAMIKAAVAARGELGLIGVTALTSHSQQTLESIGVAEPMDDYVLRLARLGMKCGIQGLVASAREVAMLRKESGNIRIITPGIRPAWSEANDQKRTTTPRQAVDAGADYIVIGRPITAGPDPVAALNRILQELDT